MYSKVKLFGHPLHPMLVPFPIAFYVGACAAYVVYAFQGDPLWFRLAFAANVAGIVMAVVAAGAGFFEWLLAIPNGTRAKKDGVIHMSLNSTALALFAANVWLNAGQWNESVPVMQYAVPLSLLGVLATVAAGHLGWKLVQVHHLGVELTPTEIKRMDCEQCEQCEDFMRRAA
jgi:uncharacterized membrane protein